jgi:photosystem II stability/assembly factor-like uncharacterized protein
VLAFLALVLTASAARANGAFPRVSQIVPDPVDPERVLLRSTFGVVVTVDGGANWDWICESAAGYLDIEPPLTVLEGGRVILGLPGGVSRTSDAGCQFSMAEGLDANVVDVSRVASEPERVVALSRSDTDSQVWESTDAGVSFHTLGEALVGVRATTLDVAPSDADWIYVSGFTGGTTDAGAGVFYRSEDRGATWQTFPVPETTSAKRPYIAAIDPDERELVYVRTDGLPGRLFVTRDGGEHFTEALRLDVPIQGFALSPDGNTVLATNVYDGSFRADADSLTFEKIACRGPTCLSWTEAGLFGCGDNVADGFIIGRSNDEGATFERVVDLSCIRGPYACDASTIVGSECPLFWPTIRTQLNADVCSPTDVPPYTGCFSPGGAAGEAGADGAGGMPTGGAGGAANTGNPDDAGSSGSSGAGGSPEGGEPGKATAGAASGEGPGASGEPGCGCSLPGARRDGEVLSGLGILLLIARRRATRRARGPTRPA